MKMKMNNRIITLQAVSKMEYREIAEIQKQALLAQLSHVLVVGSEINEVITLLSANVADHATYNYVKNKIFWVTDKMKTAKAEQHEIRGYSIEADLSPDSRIMYANVLDQYEALIDYWVDVRICLENKLHSV